MRKGEASGLSALLLPNEILSMPAQSARRLVEAGDGDAALLYLALLDRGTGPDGARARLRWPQERLDRAWGRLAALEFRSTDLYTLLWPQVPPCGTDYTESIIKV